MGWMLTTHSTFKRAHLSMSVLLPAGAGSLCTALDPRLWLLLLAFRCLQHPACPCLALPARPCTLEHLHGLVLGVDV